MQVNVFNEEVVEAKPFLKWAGGKKQLLPTIEKRLPPKIQETKKIKNYFEPFVGAGALFFHLSNKYNIKKSYISDINSELILTYKIIQNYHKELINNLKIIQDEFLAKNQDERKKYYNKLRDEYNHNLEDFDYTVLDDISIKRASYTIFFNKTGFNGLFRVNKKGKFNVPCGKYKNPKICDEENIVNVHSLLSKHII